MADESKRKKAAEYDLETIHRGHANHLCELTRKRELRKVAKLSRNAQYLCRVCGRAAAKSSNLCEPVEI